MNSTRMHIVVDEGLLRRIDERRGLASRSAFVRDIVDRACSGLNVTIQAGPQGRAADAVARAADQAERTVPAPPPPERWESQGTEAEVERPPRPPRTTEQVGEDTKRVIPELEAQLKDEDLKRPVPPIRRSPTSAAELEGLRNIAGVQRASNFVKPGSPALTPIRYRCDVCRRFTNNVPCPKHGAEHAREVPS